MLKEIRIGLTVKPIWEENECIDEEATLDRAVKEFEDTSVGSVVRDEGLTVDLDESESTGEDYKNNEADVDLIYNR